MGYNGHERDVEKHLDPLIDQLCDSLSRTYDTGVPGVRAYFVLHVYHGDNLMLSSTLKHRGCAFYCRLV